MSNQLTYILGAGASYQSIPVVRTFNKRLLKFKSFLYNQSNIETGSNRQMYNEAVNSIETLFKEFSSHHSFDTYFKKLFHLGDSDSINLRKRLLHLYFLWEHSSTSLNYNEVEYEPAEEDFFYKQSRFDRRYDALIAGLLKPISGQAQPLCNINFITWNYDINLLNSIKNFFYPTLTYKDFFTKIQKNQFVWEIDTKIKILNVNGFFYNSRLNNAKDLSNINIDEIIKSMLCEGYHSSKKLDEDADKIRFAWELSEKDSNSLYEYLTLVIEASENIIIVGYTFPVYNRFIDFGYLKQKNLLEKNIVIQDPRAEILKQSLLDIYKIQDKGNIQAVSGCDSFYMPSSVFGVKEYQASWGGELAFI
jgi:hypothetical protein